MFYLGRAVGKASEARVYWNESAVHSNRCVVASYGMDIETAQREYDIALDLYEKGDSVYRKMWRFK